MIEEVKGRYDIKGWYLERSSLAIAPIFLIADYQQYPGVKLVTLMRNDIDKKSGLAMRMVYITKMIKDRNFFLSEEDAIKERERVFLSLPEQTDFKVLKENEVIQQQQKELKKAKTIKDKRCIQKSMNEDSPDIGTGPVPLPSPPSVEMIPESGKKKRGRPRKNAS